MYDRFEAFVEQTTLSSGQSRDAYTLMAHTFDRTVVSYLA